MYHYAGYAFQTNPELENYHIVPAPLINILNPAASLDQNFKPTKQLQSPVLQMSLKQKSFNGRCSPHSHLIIIIGLINSNSKYIAVIRRLDENFLNLFSTNLSFWKTISILKQWHYIVPANPKFFKNLQNWEIAQKTRKIFHFCNLAQAKFIIKKLK